MTEWRQGKSVSWDKSRSMIQLCARQGRNEKKKNRGTESREKKGETEGEERKCCEYSRDGKKKETRKNI